MGLILQIISFLLTINMHSCPVLVETNLELECNETMKAVAGVTTSTHHGSYSFSQNSCKTNDACLSKHFRRTAKAWQQQQLLNIFLCNTYRALITFWVYFYVE